MSSFNFECTDSDLRGARIGNDVVGGASKASFKFVSKNSKLNNVKISSANSDQPFDMETNNAQLQNVQVKIDGKTKLEGVQLVGSVGGAPFEVVVSSKDAK